ncbi:lipoprotein NlpI [Luteitalea pratensis]|uniref:Lipoprotein NlpI n=1 Tax=Luteitalea pratensis TaxID=1855912 RepID=A0A143PUH7_LUTPR|nr:tetratricopeptide repeat protein [Luteitalea pratensis]AMY12242.1 lipoprotein NlpI [Luteitalea pratensis]
MKRLRITAALVAALAAVPAWGQAPPVSATHEGTPPAGKAGGTSVAAKAPAPARAASATLSKANKAREGGDLEGAIGLYRQVVKVSPRQIDAWWYLGTSLYDLERWGDARAAFDHVVRLDKNNGAALAFRGLCTFRQGQYVEALDDLQRARALGVSGNPEVGSVARFHAGLAMTRLSRFEPALNTIGEFALEGNDSPQIIEALGVATLRMPLLPSELPPEKREMVMMAGRGSYFMAMRLAPAARTAFEELALRYPDVPNVHYAFGIFLMSEDADRALKEFERELSVQPAHAPSHIQMAFEYIRRADYASARRHAKDAVTLAPTDFIAHRLIGQIELETGDTQAAIASLEQSRRLEPNSPTVYFTLAKAYARAGRDADAEKARAEFTRLDRLSRLQRNGVTAVGGMTP